MWRILPFLKPKYENARRFVGKVGWNKLLVGKSETLHSVSFKSSNWVELKGFEMLRGDFSYKLTYTITKGQGVMGKRVAKGSSFVRSGSLLNPLQKVTFTASKRLEPSQWYTINVVLDIHEYDMNLITSMGSDGVSQLETDSGVIIEYSAGLESCALTTSKSGQIAGILFSRFEQEDERLYSEERLRRRSRTSASSQCESSVGSEDEADIPKILTSGVEKPLINETADNDKVSLPLSEQVAESRSDACAVYPVSPEVQQAIPIQRDENIAPSVSISTNIDTTKQEYSQGSIGAGITFFGSAYPQRPLLIRPQGGNSILQPTMTSLTPTMRTEDLLRQYMHPYTRK
jgi:hypothetical protein